MLEAAVRSLALSSVPDAARLRILVVENDTAPTLEPKALHALVGDDPLDIDLAYIHHPEIGIAAARNAALDHARAGGFDWLAFIDDDETVARDWLVQLTAAAETRRLVLTGGPVRPVLAASPEGLMARLVWQGYKRHRKRHNQRSVRACDTGREDRITTVTNNWLFDLCSPATTDLRFDPRFDMTGGEDTDFYRRAKRRGATSGWAPKAIAYETIPAARLTAGYQFRRAAHQHAVRLREKTAGCDLPARVAIVGARSSIDLLAALLHMAFVVPTLGWTLYDAIRYTGAFYGDLVSLGRPCEGFYRHVTGE